jgi:hypothetical protein
MEYRNILDIDDDLQMFALHTVYVPMIQQNLDEFTGQHNCYGLRTEHGMTPRQLYTASGLANFNSNTTAILSMRDMEVYGIEPPRRTDGVENPPDDVLPVHVSPVRSPLNAEQHAEMLERISRVETAPVDDIKVLRYKCALEAILEHLAGVMIHGISHRIMAVSRFSVQDNP